MSKINALTITTITVIILTATIVAAIAIIEKTVEEQTQVETATPVVKIIHTTQELPVPDLTPVEPESNIIDALAKTVYGEARGLSQMEQAAVVWCILNRADAAETDNLMQIITAPNQFCGYSPSNPVLPKIAELVKDVLTRWQIEKNCVGDVGRVLPKDYLYFTGDGKHNYFRKVYNSTAYWDWSLPNPYEVNYE